MAEAGCKVGSNALWVGFSLSQAGAKAVGDVVPAASSENMKILLGSGNLQQWSVGDAEQCVTRLTDASR